MAELWGRFGGVNRKLRELYGSTGGATRKLKGLYGLSGGASRKIFSGIQYSGEQFGYWSSDGEHSYSYIRSDGSFEVYSQTEDDNTLSAYVRILFDSPIITDPNVPIFKSSYVVLSKWSESYDSPDFHRARIYLKNNNSYVEIIILDDKLQCFDYGSDPTPTKQSISAYPTGRYEINALEFYVYADSPASSEHSTRFEASQIYINESLVELINPITDL